MPQDPSQKFREGQTARVEVGTSGDDIRCTVEKVEKVLGYGAAAYRYTVRGENGKTYKARAGYGDTLISDESSYHEAGTDEAAAGTFAQDAHGRDLARGAAVEVLAGEDAGQHGRIHDVTGNYITVTFPDGSALRTSAGNVRLMSLGAALTCPYCTKVVTLDVWSRLGDHRTVGGVCDGAGRLVVRAEGGRAVFA